MKKREPKERKDTGDLVNVPMGAAGTLANEYLDLNAEINERRERQVVLGAKLVRALMDEKRQQIKLRGLTLTIKAVQAQTKISITKAGSEKKAS